DIQPFPVYGVGVIAIFVSRQHQRLGDLVAGTLVVRDQNQDAPSWGASSTRTFTSSSFVPGAPIPEPHEALILPTTGIAKLSAADLEVLEGFFSRRLDMSLPTRRAIAERLAAAIREKSGLEPPADSSIETFLEATARQLRDVARMR